MKEAMPMREERKGLGCRWVLTARTAHVTHLRLLPHYIRLFAYLASFIIVYAGDRHKRDDDVACRA